MSFTFTGASALTLAFASKEDVAIFLIVHFGKEAETVSAFSFALSATFLSTGLSSGFASGFPFSFTFAFRTNLSFAFALGLGTVTRM